MNREDEAQRLREPVGDADVLIDGYRQHRLVAGGFGVDELAKLRPRLIHVSVNCYASGGAFVDRAG
ncbi:CoA transferase [Paraburkholderia tropica]|uniref:CoA transferase n=1 Tax=Paraburkholderia tropica TaxID=92647 RepID=UPI0038BCE325